MRAVHQLETSSIGSCDRELAEDAAVISEYTDTRRCNKGKVQFLSCDHDRRDDGTETHEDSQYESGNHCSCTDGEFELRVNYLCG